MTLRSAVFLDRDGVINRAIVGLDGIPHPPASPEDVELLPGVEDACALLRGIGYVLVMVTNQPDVARGTQSRNTVEAINALICNRVGIDHVSVCYHDDSDGCGCRKPRPGLLVEAARTQGIDLAASFIVGDRSRDIEAGRRAGCGTILLGDGYGESLLAEPDTKMESLTKAADWIAAQGRSHIGAGGSGQRHGD